ncbi:MAG: hypothetical protein M0O93_03650 [Bacteroidales bacterium]|nr:hypothetical protein [Bacteroidales bacterium]
MYRGFYLSVSKNDFRKKNNGDSKSIGFYYYYDLGIKLFEKYKDITIKGFEDFLKDDSLSDINDMTCHLSNKINGLIFIPNSPKDKEIAVALSGYLFEKYELNCFIYSSNSGYSDDLYNVIIDILAKYKNDKNINKKKLDLDVIKSRFDLHFNNMINKTKCLFFLNNLSPLLLPELKIESLSNWFSSELGIKGLETSSEDNVLISLDDKNESENCCSATKILSNLNLDHLCKLDKSYIFGNKTSEKGESFLDFLYNELKPNALNK